VYLTGLLHRDELCDITLRWLNDDLHPDDGRRLTEIFLYESVVSAPLSQDFMLRALSRLYGDGLSVERIQFKHRLRERLLQCIPASTPRIKELAQYYHERPEEFFPRLPVDAVLLFSPERGLVSISRIKRPQRAAEKAAYRMADALAGAIRKEAEVIASERAIAKGVALSELVSTQEQMSEDFIIAEARVAEGFRRRTIELDREALVINDIVGFKLIGDEDELARAEQALRAEPNAKVVEKQVHRGHYNATNLLVDIELPPIAQLVDDASKADWSVATARGLSPEDARAHFADYVESGPRTIRTEIILTTYPELLESEFGRSLHELRILRLRERQPYKGQIADNARYLIEYLFQLAYSPTIHVSELPIKMWGRYLPDVLLAATRALYGIRSDGVLLRSLSL
jgi:hypothetical protein